MPPTIKARDSPNGLYAVAGTKLAGGSVEQAGGRTTVAAKADGDSAPPELHVHTEDLEDTGQPLSVQMLVGEDGKAASNPVKVTWHASATPEDTLVYVDGDVGPDSHCWSKTHHDNGTTIEFCTDDSGSADVRTNTHPAVWERLIYDARAAIDLPDVGTDSIPFVGSGITPARTPFGVLAGLGALGILGRRSILS